MSEHEKSNKSNKELKDSWDNDEKNQPFLQKMISPSDINGIQTEATQVWNFDEFGFDPNGRRNKFIYTYKLFQGKRMWKVKTVEQVTLWCT